MVEGVLIVTTVFIGIVIILFILAIRKIAKLENQMDEMQNDYRRLLVEEYNIKYNGNVHK